MDVLEVKPNGAASIVETDVEIDFAEPVGYQDSEYGRQERERKQSRDFGGESGGLKPGALQKARSDSLAEDANTPKFVPFAGAGKRIDGKATSTTSSSSTAIATATVTSSTTTTTTTAGGIASSGGGLRIGSASTMSSSSTTATSSASASTVVAAPTAAPGYQSKIGDKFSKKKVTTSAFTGTGNKLS